MSNENEIPVQEKAPTLEAEIDTWFDLIKNRDEGELMGRLNYLPNSLSEFQIGDKDVILSKLKMIKEQVENGDFQDAFKGLVESLVEVMEDRLQGKEII